MGTIKTFDIDLVPEDLEFTVLSGDEIKRLSVVKIITGLTFDPLGHPLPGGLYDNLMGTYGRRMEPCTTCFNVQSCPGHMGHIELNALVYNPFFIQLVRRILSVFCLHCFKIQMKDHLREVLILQLRLIDAGYIIEAQELEVFKSEIAYQNTDQLVKLENGDVVHPRIGELEELLRKENSVTCQSTKTSCAIRTALVHATMQRPTNNKCIHCQKPLRNVRYLYRKLVYYLSAADLKNSMPEITQSAGQNKVIFADECRKFLRQIYENYPELLNLLCPVLQLSSKAVSNAKCPVDIFFMDTIMVTPPKARPSSVMREQILEHPQTASYRSIVENNAVVRVVLRHLKGLEEELSDEAKKVYESAKGATSHEKFYNAWQMLQSSIDVLLDVNMTRDAPSAQGLKQVLEKKEGLIRKHMMGKRVNYAARTVITPDPNINVDEVGIPDIFARKLSYPVRVTPWNLPELRKMVMNGPDVHPGANYIQDEKGYTTLIPANDSAKRESLAKMLYSFPENGLKVVHRHLLDGDILLLNRQPSLHRPSIMAHKARILQGEKTFRLHYSNCKAYNADFDGDEMNAHLPQNELARAEAYQLVNVASNYLVPKDGTPLGGLIQDHVISGVKLSIRGRFFNRDDYQQLVFQGLSHIKGNIKLLAPTILRPMQLWSGKQVLSTIIMNLIPDGYKGINLQSFAKIAGKQWNVSNSRRPMCGTPLNGDNMSESQVIIRNGELLAGVLDKQQYGATTFGLIHCMYELYGGDVSTCLLTAFTKVFTHFLQREGFTLGVKDILVTEEADGVRRKIIKDCRKAGEAAVAAALDLTEQMPLNELTEKMEEAYIKDPKFRVTLDRKYKSLLDGYTNRINSTCLPNGLITKFPANNLQLMVLSGAKGSMVNTMQISCLLGQIELEGKRPPLMISGKSLPSFTSFETSPKSGGFIDGRFMTGIQPQDFFFHCMAGREGLIDTAVKTSRSGYLQRCLIKHLEGLTVNYDLTVRDSDSTVVQFLYGEDGLDILKSKFFNPNFGAKFLTHNAKVILRPDEVEICKDEESLTRLLRHNKKVRSWQKKHKRQISEGSTKTLSAFTHFSASIQSEIDIERPNEINPKNGRTRLTNSLIQLWRKTHEDDQAEYQKKALRCPQPATAAFRQDLHYGSVSEKVQKIIDNCSSAVLAHKEALADVLYMKNIRALAAPGDPVGLLAAQSIGEPSTQMTLNTFHFAGRGEMNVTLGIPRLREILMLASANLKTPSMDVPVEPMQEQNAEKLRLKLNRVTLADVLEYVNVKIKLVVHPERALQYQLHFQFLPREVYVNDFCVRPKRILKYISETFFKQLFRAILKYSTNKATVVEIGDKKSGNAKEDGEGNDDDEIDATGKSKKSKPPTEDNAEDSSDEERADDDDATGIKLKSRNQDETEYDDPEEVEEIASDAEDDDVIPIEETKEASFNEQDDEVVKTLLNNKMVSDYVYDKDRHLWCKLTFNLSVKYKKPDISSIIRELASKSVIHQVQNLKRAIIYKDDQGKSLLKTDGININEMFKHDRVLAINRLYSNDIHAIARTYGIEAAKQCITQEVSNVFKVYGITVDQRHLSLIADYMTFDGTFQPLSRKGLEHSASPLQQMSFESCLQFLKSATASGRSDGLDSPSSRLMVGLPVKNGTGIVQLLAKMC